MNKINKLAFLVWVLNISVGLVVFVFITKINSLYTKYELRIEELNRLKEDFKDYLRLFDIPGISIAIYIKDLTTEYSIGINDEEKIPSASLIKIPIMAAIYYLAEEGEISLDNVLIYKKHHYCSGSGIIKNIPFGSKFKVKELIELMITVSDNIATQMLTEYVGLKKLDEIFKKLELENTNISRYIMDLKKKKEGIENYTTAKDIGILLEKIYKGKLVSKLASSEMLFFLMKQKICDRIPRLLPKEVIVANKTGLMKDVCHDAGIVFTNNGDFIICILTKNLDHKIAKKFIAEVAYKTYCLYKNKENIDETTNTNSSVGSSSRHN